MDKDIIILIVMIVISIISSISKKSKKDKEEEKQREKFSERRPETEFLEREEKIESEPAVSTSHQQLEDFLAQWMPEEKTEITFEEPNKTSAPEAAKTDYQKFSQEEIIDAIEIEEEILAEENTPSLSAPKIPKRKKPKHSYKDTLRKKSGLKQAVIMKEILTRKEF